MTLFLTGCVVKSMAGPPKAREPALSLVTGITWSSPFAEGAGIRGDYGWRGGLAYSGVLSAGELRLPLETGFILRTATLRFSDYFGKTVFTDLQVPFIFHGPLFPDLPRLEILALWTPSYTLNVVSSSRDAGEITYTGALRTRFNMGFGVGLGFSAGGFGLRSHWVYNIFSPFPASNLTFSDWGIETTAPLRFKRSAP